MKAVATRQQWRCQQQKPHSALKEGAQAASRPDCCSGGNGVGGGAAATRQQWRCQQQKRSALKEGKEAVVASMMVSVAGRQEQWQRLQQQWQTM